jgi:ubiquitin-like modifier-activating enzyme ATG7
MALLRFQTTSSKIDVSFWHELGEKKLNTLRLSEEPISLTATQGPNRYDQVPIPLTLTDTSFSSPTTPGGAKILHGKLLNLNVLDSFSSYDKISLMREAAHSLWTSITSGEAAQNPAILSTFLLLSHADLKRYLFSYHLACPALKPPSPFLIHSHGADEANAAPLPSLLSHLNDKVKAGAIADACDLWLRSSNSQPFWLVDSKGTSLPFSSWPSLVEDAERGPFFLAFSDPSNDQCHPGWPLRNFLLLAAVSLPQSFCRVNILCVREGKNGRVSPERSLLLKDVELPILPDAWYMEFPGDPAVGWEADDQGKQRSRSVDLGSLMNPLALAEQALSLNLKLMKWRAAPSLNIDAMAATRCLLIGAGTLGSAVARTLLAWGIKKITLVDSSTISYSNPPRQWLYDHEDSKAAKPKAKAAAEALKRILPSLDTTGISLSVPMPGHAPGSGNKNQEEAIHQAMEELGALILDHDAIFLLTDTRESRWLPTLLATAHDKITITAALGFDSYLVMRNGPLSSDASRLGCYFCNDVVGPSDSMSGRTIDQQCTVARPGLAPIASALAVELLAAIVMHPQGIHAPALDPSCREQDRAEDLPLGQVPHMIRGQLHGFGHSCMCGTAFKQCTACSAPVVNELKDRGWDFVLDALRDPQSIERASGLSDLKLAMDANEMDLDDAEGGEAGGYEEWDEI